MVFKFIIEASKSTPTTKMHEKPEILTVQQAINLI